MRPARAAPVHLIVKAMLAFLLLAPATASADDDVELGYPGPPDYSRPLPDTSLRVEAGIASDAGNLSLGSIDDVAEGLHLEVGARYDRFALAADLGWLIVADRLQPPPTPTVGRPIVTTPGPAWSSIRRDMIYARYTLTSGPTPVTAKHSNRILSFVRGDSWLELGIGREDVTQHPGDEVSRRVLSVGLGVESTGRRDGTHLSAYVAVRLLRAANPAGGTDHELVVSLNVLGGN